MFALQEEKKGPFFSHLHSVLLKNSDLSFWSLWSQKCLFGLLSISVRPLGTCSSGWRAFSINWERFRSPTIYWQLYLISIGSLTYVINGGIQKIGKHISPLKEKTQRLKITQNVPINFFNFGIFHQFLSNKRWPVW